MNIYLASPLHDRGDQEKSKAVVEVLRNAGHRVYLPMDHGVVKGEDCLLDPEVQHRIYYGDIQAMQRCDCCVAFVHRAKGPSEGMLWEMGYCYGNNKPVYLINPNHDWPFGIMVRGGIYREFDDAVSCAEYLSQEDFV